MMASFNLWYFSNNKAFIAVIYLGRIQRSFRIKAANWLLGVAIIIVSTKQFFIYILYLKLFISGVITISH